MGKIWILGRWLIGLIMIAGWALQVGAMQFYDVSGNYRGGYSLTNGSYILDTSGRSLVIVPTPSTMAVSGNLSITGNLTISGGFTVGGLTYNSLVSVTNASPNALFLQSGNDSVNTSNRSQIIFDSATYPGTYHAIKTKHSSSSAAGNSIDFYVWAPSLSANKQVMTIRGDGRVGINTDSPTSELTVNGDLVIQSNCFVNYLTSKAGVTIAYNATYPIPCGITFEAGAAYNGGTTGNRSAIGISSDNLFHVVNYNGTTWQTHAVLGNNGSWTAGSDRRLKKAIQPLSPILDKVMKLEPVTYLFTHDPDTASRNIGFIAQSVLPYFPELVGNATGNKGNGPPTFLTLNYSGFGVVAIKAIQELVEEKDVKIKKLTIKLTELIEKNRELNHRLDTLEKAVVK